MILTGVGVIERPFSALRRGGNLVVSNAPDRLLKRGSVHFPHERGRKTSKERSEQIAALDMAAPFSQSEIAVVRFSACILLSIKLCREQSEACRLFLYVSAS